MEISGPFAVCVRIFLGEGHSEFLIEIHFIGCVPVDRKHGMVIQVVKNVPCFLF